jgi:hypothetical protein
MTARWLKLSFAVALAAGACVPTAGRTPAEPAATTSVRVPSRSSAPGVRLDSDTRPGVSAAQAQDPPLAANSSPAIPTADRQAKWSLFVKARLDRLNSVVNQICTETGDGTHSAQGGSCIPRVR